MLTLRPIKPRHAIEGIAVDMAEVLLSFEVVERVSTLKFRELDGAGAKLEMSTPESCPATTTTPAPVLCYGNLPPQLYITTYKGPNSATWIKFNEEVSCAGHARTLPPSNASFSS